MINRIIMGILLCAVWFILNWRFDAIHIVTGILVAGLVSWITGGLFDGHPFRCTGIRPFFVFFFWYVPVLVWECARASVDVAWRVVHPRIPLKPGFVKVRTSLRSDTALTFLCNSISLTPGTLTIDVDREHGFLYVHWIHVRSTDIDEATRHIVTRFERILREIFE